jgi:nucleotide-binding universal stress UspA family protein
VSYRHVMVGSDGSDTAHIAVQQAAELAKAFGARLTIVTAYPKVRPRTAAGVPDDMQWMATDASSAEAQAKKGMQLAKQVGVDDVHTSVAPGDPAEVVLDAAKMLGADLLLLGNKGMASASRFLLGNVPNKVSHHAPCDMIIVRTAG